MCHLIRPSARAFSRVYVLSLFLSFSARQCCHVSLNGIYKKNTCDFIYIFIFLLPPSFDIIQRTCDLKSKYSFTFFFFISNWAYAQLSEVQKGVRDMALRGKCAADLVKTKILHKQVLGTHIMFRAL